MLLKFTPDIQQNCHQLCRNFEKSICAVDRLSCQLELSKSETSQFRSDLVFDIVNYVPLIFLNVVLRYLRSSDFCVAEILWASYVPESSRCWCPTSFQLPDYDTIVSHFARHAMWFICIDILKIVNWKWTVSVEIHNNSSLSTFQVGPDIKLDLWSHIIEYVMICIFFLHVVHYTCYVYLYIYLCIYIYIFIYIHTNR